MIRLGLVWSCALLAACGGEALQSPQGGAGSPSSVGGAANAGAGAGGEAGAPQGQALDPVVILRGEPDADYDDLIVRGRDLDAYEGAVVSVRIGFGGGPSDVWSERLGSGQARIRQGTFELHFPQVWESTLYKVKNVYIDADGDGRCSEGDPVYSDAAAVLLDNTLYIPTPFPSSFETCEPFERPWPTE